MEYSTQEQEDAASWEQKLLVLVGLNMFVGILVWQILPVFLHQLPARTHVGFSAVLAWSLAQILAFLLLPVMNFPRRDYWPLMVPFAAGQMILMFVLYLIGNLLTV